MRKICTVLVGFLLLLSSCSQLYRSIRYWTPDIDEYNAFPQVKINCSDKKFYFTEKTDSNSIVLTFKSAKDTTKITLDEYIKKSTTTAFLIIKNDTVVFEKYYHGYNRADISTLFSVTKSVTALLVGIAVDEGYIKSVNDPVTNYIPELLDGDPTFQKLTIEHLLNMQTGIDFEESYTNPFTGMARLFYGNDQLRYLKKLKFYEEPGQDHDYISAATAILGIALERAINKSYAEYLEEKIWKPLGMQYDATISLDDNKHRSAKSYVGLNATAIDLAKIGRLFLNNGRWNVEQIISPDWVYRSSIPEIEKDHYGMKYKGYQYHWYNKHSVIYDPVYDGRFKDSLSALNYAKESSFKYFKIWYFTQDENPYWGILEYHPQYFAIGIMNQILYIDPERNLIMVRLGKDWDWDFDFLNLMYAIGKKYPIVN